MQTRNGKLIMQFARREMSNYFRNLILLSITTSKPRVIKEAAHVGILIQYALFTTGGSKEIMFIV